MSPSQARSYRAYSRQSSPSPSSRSSAGAWALVGITLLNVVIVVALLPLARRGVSWLLEDIDRSGSEEMLTLAAVVIALVVSVGMVIVFGLSVALGAFFAGIIVSGSRLSHRV